MNNQLRRLGEQLQPKFEDFKKAINNDSYKTRNEVLVNEA